MPAKNTRTTRDADAKWKKQMTANFNALLTKLDADAGVTDTNYNSTLVVTTTEPEE